MGGQVLDIPRADSPGGIEIRASMNDQEKATNLDELYYDGCVRAIVMVEEGGRLTTLLTHEESGCSSESLPSTENGTIGSAFHQR